jgi:hydrogenase maturation protease
MTHPRILVAGIGNIFLGDDAFGVEVAQRLVQRPQPAGVRIGDFGIRGLDLTYALLDGYEAVVFVDALARGGSPGTLYLLEPDVPQASAASVEMHNVDPVKVLQLAAALGGRVDRLLVAGCEPTPLDASAEMQMGLSAPVRAAVDRAVPLIEAVIGQLLRGENVAVESNSIIPEKEVSPCRD